MVLHMETAPHPTIAKSIDHEDGTVTIAYSGEQLRPEDYFEATYADRGTANVESLLILFPGTSRSFLEGCRKNPS